MAANSQAAKFLLIRAMRAAGLLRLADWCRFVLRHAKAWPANRRFRRTHPGFLTPPRHLAFDAINHFDWERYRRTGLQHAGLFARVVREELEGRASLCILEWGCGPGRIIRHMRDLLPGMSISLWGSDYNAESIAWCRKCLPGITFVENGLNPPLPSPDAQFDVVYCFSVLTHLSEPVQLAWMKELRRVLKPGGLLICTTHGDAYRYLLSAQHEQRAYDAGRVVVQGRYREGRKWFVSIQPPAFVRDHLLEGWSDVRRPETQPEDNILQDLWIARKPGEAVALPAAVEPHRRPTGAHRAPRFSIIMNVYNGEAFLREALASVFAQTLDDWELIFWDDQSTDRSEAVLRGFPPDPRVRYFRAERRAPLTVARRAAIAEARGEWLAFLDQDDIWTPDKLEKQARAIDEAASDSLGIVYGRAMRFGDAKLVREFDSTHEFGDLPQGDIFEELFLNSCFICQSASCMRTDFVREVGDIPPQFECCSDYYLYTALASRHTAACTQDVVCWYRVHSGAMTALYRGRVLRETLGILARWKDRIAPRVYSMRFRMESSMLGWCEITSGEDPVGGIRRITRDGSFAYLLGRPFSRAQRVARRGLRYLRRGVERRPRYS